MEPNSTLRDLIIPRAISITSLFLNASYLQSVLWWKIKASPLTLREIWSSEKYKNAPLYKASLWKCICLCCTLSFSHFLPFSSTYLSGYLRSGCSPPFVCGLGSSHVVNWWIKFHQTFSRLSVRIVNNLFTPGPKVCIDASSPNPSAIRIYEKGNGVGLDISLGYAANAS